MDTNSRALCFDTSMDGTEALVSKPLSRVRHADGTLSSKFSKKHLIQAKRFTQCVVIICIMFTVLYGLTKFSSVHIPQMSLLKPPNIRNYTANGSTTQHNYSRVMEESVFNIKGSLSNLEIFNGIYTSDYDCGNEMENIDVVKSDIYITQVNETNGQVDVAILTYDRYGNKKMSGGDILVIWANGTTFKRVAGSVTDHLNGSYTGKLKFHWPGVYTIHAKVLSVFRTHCLRFKAMKKYGNSVFSLKKSFGIIFTFKRGSRSDATRCGPTNFIYGYKELCNFTTFNMNYSYYCGKPSYGLDCSDVQHFRMRKYDFKGIDLNMTNEDIIYLPGWGPFIKTVKVSIKALKTSDNNNSTPYCFLTPKVDSWTTSPYKMFIDHGTWKHISCRTKDYTKSYVRRCLANKRVFLIGDSTIRQYVDAIGTKIHEKVTYYPFYVTVLSDVDKINITWRKHELPYHNVDMRNPYHVNSTANQIFNIANDDDIVDSDLIVFLTYNSHLQAFPPSIFRDRIKHLAKALQYLFIHKPKATVLFKGPHITNEGGRWFDIRISLIYIEILFEEFEHLKHKVWYLDVFTLSTLNNNQQLHPTGVALQNQFQQFLAYICL